MEWNISSEISGEGSPRGTVTRSAAHLFVHGMQRPLPNVRLDRLVSVGATLQTFSMRFPSKSTSSNASLGWYGGCTAARACGLLTAVASAT
jgi:hypothetical protein